MASSPTWRVKASRSIRYVKSPQGNNAECGFACRTRRACQAQEMRMRYFLDSEFNGFGGELISIALVPENPDLPPFYEAVPCAHPSAWAAEHVMPVLRTLPISRPEVTTKLAAYLHGDQEP